MKLKKLDEFTNKHINIFLFVLILIFGIELITLFNQEYFFSFLIIFLTFILYCCFRKWKFLAIFLVLSALSYSVVNHYHIGLYKDTLKSFVNKKMKNSSSYEFRTKTIDPKEDLERYNIVLAKLNTINYSLNDINVTYKGSAKNYLYFFVNVKNICFNVTTEGQINKIGPIFIIHIEDSNSCAN